jgi:hypothetical protein
MNSLTSQQRKLAYLGGILLLLVPIIMLGLPSDRSGAGGTLAQLRTKYELGESDLGDVDPSSTAMNLVLLGMRGVAVNLLYAEFEKQKNTKQWAEMQATTESIVKLQPHFEKVWDMNGHNLAYNTSAEWDAVPDRYYWVKAGGKFYMRGVRRNKKSTHLQYFVANVYQKKIGTADESKYYRYFFLHDPEPKFKDANLQSDDQGKGLRFEEDGQILMLKHHGPDPDFNPTIRDNYLVAKGEYEKACDIEDKGRRMQHILDKSLFRSMPARCQFDYAAGLQKDGKFGDITRVAWAEALSDWTTKYGQTVLNVPVGPLGTDVYFDIRLEMTLDDIKREVASPDDVVRVAKVVEQYRKMVNYYYWRTRGLCESEPTTSESHRKLYEANKAYSKQDFDKAEEAALAGLKGFDEILKMPAYEGLKDEETLVEECLLGIKVWRHIHELGDKPVPPDYPLKWLEAEHQGNPQIAQNVQRAFKRLFLDDR